MCIYCELSKKEVITLEIKKPYQNTYAKLEKAYDFLEKAMGSNHKQQAEISPYRSMRELEEKSKTATEKSLYQLYLSITQKWLGLSKADTDPFKLGTDIFINPSTGKALTKGEWATIKVRIMKAFGHVYKDQDTLLIKAAMALGKVLRSMSTAEAITASLKDVSIKLSAEIKALDKDPIFANTVMFAEEHTGELITDLSQHQYKKIHDTIMEAQINRLSSKSLETNLFEKFADMNRDWRRIAETEMANNENNGQILAELDKATDDEPVFMIGGSSGGACSWCVNKVNNKIVMMVSEPPTGGGDTVWYKEEMYTAVWPGKSNAGRKRANWWVAAGSQHPHCRCYWTRYLPGFKKEWKMLQDAVEKASAEAKIIQQEYIDNKNKLFGDTLEVS